MAFDEKKYLIDYKKEHYKAFSVDLKVAELEELNELLKKLNLTKAQFLRDAIIELKKKA